MRYHPCKHNHRIAGAYLALIAALTAFGSGWRVDSAPLLSPAVVQAYVASEDVVPSPTPLPSPIPKQSTPPTQEAIESQIRAVFGEAGELAVKVAWCESRLKPSAIGPDGNDIGVFQVRYTVHKVSKQAMLDPYQNIQFAKKLYDRSGWIPWRSSAHCWRGR